MNQYFKFLPNVIQNLIITIYNTYQYRLRHGGLYHDLREQYLLFDSSSRDEIEKESKRRLKEFLNFAIKYSPWYKNVNLKHGLSDFPILEKKDLVEKIDQIKTISEFDAITSYTGGTTGSSLKVFYTKPDIQDRNAALDNFRASFGYKLGLKTAWFSGKDLISRNDLKKGICYKEDWINKIRFFSTYHINELNFDIYWDCFQSFAPEFIVGFPSSVLVLCKIANDRGIKYNGRVKVFFPTAETVLDDHREIISNVLGCRVVDQYASSEGAPFIFECKEGNKHMNTLTGLFEVVDENMSPSNEGEMLVTSFSTHGTPLIRYRIGDSLKLPNADFKCKCGSEFPIVESIKGRSNDFLISPENGLVNLGNISNCTKKVNGIIRFQIEQNLINELIIKIVPSKVYNQREQNLFEQALRARFGISMKFIFKIVKSIPVEKSGKFRIVKNNLKNN